MTTTTVTPTTSPTTFCYAKIDLGDGLAFHVDGNSKITWDNGSFAEPKPNAFSLPHIATCPGSTERCRESCYVHDLKKYAPQVYRNYELNEMTLHRVLMAPGSRSRSAHALADWIKENASAGFRWHVSGDVFSEMYAEWIIDVCWLASEVPFWIYTRSLWAVRVLTQARNLAVNVSVDKHNYDDGVLHAQRYGARLCYLVHAPDETIPALPAGSVIFPDYDLRGRKLPEPTEHPWWKSLTLVEQRQVCPVDFFGQSETSRCGPCKKCLYPATHQESRQRFDYP